MPGKGGWMERCLFVFLCGLLLFNWPFLELFRQGLALYLYVIWLVYIVVLAIIIRRAGATTRPPQAGPGEGPA